MSKTRFMPWSCMHVSVFKFRNVTNIGSTSRTWHMCERVWIKHWSISEEEQCQLKVSGKE